MTWSGSSKLLGLRLLDFTEVLHTLLTSGPASVAGCPDLPQLAPPPPAHHTHYAARWKGTISSIGTAASAPPPASTHLFSAEKGNMLFHIYLKPIAHLHASINKMLHGGSYCEII